VVVRDDSVTDVKILRGIGGGCDEEALSVIRNMPKWEPGKQHGKPVRVQFNMPLKFTLSG
jgi:protein TonB